MVIIVLFLIIHCLNRSKTQGISNAMTSSGTTKYKNNVLKPGEPPDDDWSVTIGVS